MTELISLNRKVDKMTRPSFSIKETDSGYRIIVMYKNPETSRMVSKPFVLKMPEKKKQRLGMSLGTMQGIVQRMLSQVTMQDIKERYDKRGLSSLLSHFISKLSRRKVYGHIKKSFENEGVSGHMEKTNDKMLGQLGLALGKKDNTENSEGKDCSLPGGEVGKDLRECVRGDLERISLSLPNKSAFQPEVTGVTYGLIGKSFSGKTHFIVNQLNLLTEEELGMYTAIIFFTESTSAEPLKKLTKEIKSKMIVMDRFCPAVLLAIKKINNDSANMFKFLVIFDDILRLRGPMLTKSILTLRNANISTIISIQYEKLMNPAQRSSLHNMYIFNLRSESWEYMLKGFLFGNFKETIPCLRESFDEVGSKQAKKKLSPCQMAQLLRETLDDYIVHYDQRRDNMNIYKKGFKK